VAERERLVKALRYQTMRANLYEEFLNITKREENNSAPKPKKKK